MNAKFEVAIILALAAAQGAAHAQPIPGVYVTSDSGSAVFRFDPTTGVPLGAFAQGGGLNLAIGIAFMPGGDLLVSSANTNQVLRYNG